MEVLKQLRESFFSDYFPLFELFLAVVLAFLIQKNVFPHAFSIDALVVPLLLANFCEFLHTRHKLRMQEENRNAQFAQLENQMRAIAGLTAEEMAPLLIIKTLKRASAKVEAARIDDVWRQLTQSLKTNYYATNYIDYEHMYGNDGARAIVAAQQAKMHDDVKIEKVFITDAAAELQSAAARATIKMHLDANIPIRHISKTDIQNKLGKKSTIVENHMDFAIFDNAVVLRWHFDANRKIDGGELLFGEDEIRPYKTFFNLLRDAAKKLEKA